MVIFEDLHWIDERDPGAARTCWPTRSARAKILLLVNYRPEYSPSNGATGPTTRSCGSIRSGKRAPKRCSPRCSATASDLTPLKRLIIERTEGNPFFMEEMVQALFDEGVLVRNGAVKLDQAATQLKIPATVQGDSRRAHRPAAARGEGTAADAGGDRQGSSRSPLKRSGDDEATELERMLADLQLAEFIYEQPALGDIEYTFKHALTQEVAYNSILTERRTAAARARRRGDRERCTRTARRPSRASSLIITAAAAPTQPRRSNTCAVAG